jgi:phosphohistidine phosphatase
VKTLILLRHGKSNWDSDREADHDRPLARRGRNAAATMGLLLERAGQVPDRALTSSALRARQTLDVAVRSGGWNCPVGIVPEFYASSPGTVLNRLREEDDTASSLIIVGHEPTWSSLVSELTGGGFLRFPTGAMARIDLDIESWSRIDSDRGVMVWFLIPRLMRAAGFKADAED